MTANETVNNIDVPFLIDGTRVTEWLVTSDVYDHAHRFSREVLGIINLGEGLPPIAVGRGKSFGHVASGGEDDDIVTYHVGSNAYHTLADALLFAIADAADMDTNDIWRFVEFNRRILHPKGE